MYTRKARVTGEWTISSMKSEIKRTYDNDDQTLTITTVTDLDWFQEIQILGTDSVVEIEGVVITGRNRITFDNDGRFVQIYEYEYSVDSALSEDVMQTRTFKVQEETTGTWNFLNNIDDYKNKERLAIVIEESKAKTFVYELQTSEEDEGTPIPSLVDTYGVSNKYENGELSTIWTLRMLKNKQIIMDQNVDRFNVTTVGNIGTVYSEVGYKTQTLTRE